MSQLAVIFGGIEGVTLSDAERGFFRETDPWGYILFARNIETPTQTRALTDSLRDLAGRDNLPILIDQEGGPVARLKPPHFRKAPPARILGDCYAADATCGIEAVRLNSRLFAKELTDIGVNVDCLPVLDVPSSEMHEVIGARAYADSVDAITILGRAAAEALLEAGVLPVIKHIPGHGRATADSHLELPRVRASLDSLEAADFKPFISLKDMPLAMTAHIVYEAIDPERPATTSRKVIAEIIRGRIGFDGLLMTDDLSMKALTGTWRDKAADSLAAGCDMILHCNGDVAEMGQVAEGCRTLAGDAKRRADAALARLGKIRNTDWDEDLARFESLINPHWTAQV